MPDTQVRKNRKRTRRGKILPSLCSLLGMLILAGVILMLVPLALPRFMNCQVFNVVSGSMAPEIPVGSLIIVKPIEPELIEKGEIIAFYNEGTVVTHRVTENKTLEGEITTKGDANQEEDMRSVAYHQVIGVVTRHIPVLGDIASYVTTGLGKIYTLCLIACGIMFHMIAGKLKIIYNSEPEKEGTK